jgi:hypothetical protein
MRQGLAKRTHDYLGPAIAGDKSADRHILIDIDETAAGRFN